MVFLPATACVDAAPLELVKERLVVIGSHTGPSMITNQTVEDVN